MAGCYDAYNLDDFGTLASRIGTGCLPDQGQSTNGSGLSRKSGAIHLVCLSVLVMLFTPVFDFYVKRALEASSKQEANKNMREAGREAVNDLRLLREHRYVRAKHLAVMVAPKARGAVVGNLQFGQIVRVVESERDFSLVTWRVKMVRQSCRAGYSLAILSASGSVERNRHLTARGYKPISSRWYWSTSFETALSERLVCCSN